MTAPAACPSFAGYRFPAEIISQAVWLYFRFPLSLRMVEEMLAFRGIVVSHETLRQWGRKFGQAFANRIRRRLPRAGDKWHLDEVVLKINGVAHWLWRAVDQAGMVLDVLVQSRRDKQAAKRLVLLRPCGAPVAGYKPDMARRRRVASVKPDQSFKGRQFTAEVILWVVRWYLMFPISYRDLELMLQDRGVGIAHTTLFRWLQAYASELEKRIRPHLRPSNGSWRVDETYVRVKGRWMYLYQAVDSCGQTIDFLLSAKRDAEAAKRFFRKALGQLHTVNPRTITVDKNPAYPCAIEQLKEDSELWRFSRLRQCKFLNNIVEQDHRRVKRLVRPGLGFGGFHTARRTLAGYEAMAMIRKDQVSSIRGRDMRAQAKFVASLFKPAA